jgi:hypothetical protein
LFVLATAAHGQPIPEPDPPQPDAVAQAQYTQDASEDVLQLAAPIALYPDELVAQILTASTYPTEVVEAWRWLREHPGLTGASLADAANSQTWDPSVKALLQFPSILDNMNKNLAWTSALGDAYANAPEDVMNAVQVLRQRARAAGTLKTTTQDTVTTQDQSIVIEPASPDVVYVPAYDPWLVYGEPIDAYPDWVSVPGIFYSGPYLFWGAGLAVGAFAAFDWGWHHWGFDWHRHEALYHHEPYWSHSPTFAHAGGSDHGAFEHHAQLPVIHDGANRPVGPLRAPGPVVRGGEPFRASGFRAPVAAPQFHGGPAFRGGAFSGFDHGGVVRAYSDRGRSSFGAPMRMGGSHLSAGGFHGSGFHDGGGSHGGGGHR